jgi:hypothetical protein
VPGSYLFLRRIGFRRKPSREPVVVPHRLSHSRWPFGFWCQRVEWQPRKPPAVMLGFHCRLYRHGNRERVAPHPSARLAAFEPFPGRADASAEAISVLQPDELSRFKIMT